MVCNQIGRDLQLEPISKHSSDPGQDMRPPAAAPTVVISAHARQNPQEVAEECCTGKRLAAIASRCPVEASLSIGVENWGGRCSATRTFSTTQRPLACSSWESVPIARPTWKVIDPLPARIFLPQDEGTRPRLNRFNLALYLGALPSPVTLVMWRREAVSGRVGDRRARTPDPMTMRVAIRLLPQ